MSKSVAGAMRGRGGARVPHQLQWDVGHRAAKIDNEDFYFAFVDLRCFDESRFPDVYITPSTFVHAYLKPWTNKVTRLRLHVPIEEMKPYQSAWHLLAGRLKQKQNG